MISPEEQADKELRERLQQKFDGYKMPVKDEVRERVFAVLDKSPTRFYWVTAIGGLLLITGFFLSDLIKIQTGFDQKDLSVFGKDKNEDIRPTQASSDLQIQQNAIAKMDRKQKNADQDSENADKEVTKKPIIQKQQTGKSDRQKAENIILSTSMNSPSVTDPEKASQVGQMESFYEKTDIKINNNQAATLIDQSELALITPIDSVSIPVSVKAFTVPPISTKDAIKRPGNMHSFKGIFSASVLQTFQLVKMSQSAADPVQNFRFAPLLSSKSVSYKLTAGVERKNTQFLLSYTYLRNWNEYEIGTNQVIAMRVGKHQYNMTRIGEKHLENERSHLPGIGIRQRFMMPRNVLKNYSINLGVDYTRLIPKGQDLVWGNIGIYKNIFQSGGTRFEIGPYFEYSFIERESAGKMWKSRPYQVGISLGVKLK